MATLLPSIEIVREIEPGPISVRYLRVVTLEDKVTIHNAFLDRGFEP